MMDEHRICTERKKISNNIMLIMLIRNMLFTSSFAFASVCDGVPTFVSPICEGDKLTKRKL